MKPRTFYSEFGRLVRSHRNRLKLTQGQLAERIGLSRTSITNIEQGRQKILLHQLYQLADALQINPSTLLPSVSLEDLFPEVDEKLSKHLKASRTEKEWARRIVVGMEGEVLGVLSED